MKALITPLMTRYAIASFTKQLATIKSLRIAICAISACICMVCGVEGGYQLHLSHEHAALSCLKLSVPIPVGPSDGIDPIPYVIAAACNEPDQPGERWRLELVLLDMLGFIAFGTIGFHKSKQILFAGSAGD